jgi:1,4-alpha-glucan branching enzyme
MSEADRIRNAGVDDAVAAVLRPDEGEAEAIRRGAHIDPHHVLGAHPVRVGDRPAVVLRAFHPDAVAVDVLVEGEPAASMQALGGGLYAALLSDRSLPFDYRLRFHFAGGATWERRDPYRFLPVIGDLDLYLLGEGSHRRLWQVLGAHRLVVDGVAGVNFAVWAPNARAVSVNGDFCAWDGRLLPMRHRGASGVFELFVPDLEPGALYKFEIRTREGMLRVKADPFAARMEVPPGTASRVFESHYQWGDGEWMSERPRHDWAREPMSIYELHAGSWARVPEEGNRSLNYRELAHRLTDHCKHFGFTHVELLPVAEHAFYGSWGYQVTGYYAPTSRYGTPDDFRYFVDHCHREGIGVIIDWVPAHFPKDDFALRRFDGTALFEHDDPRVGEHPDWGTLIFNYGRNEVRNFLVANALCWLTDYHVDGLRVDAVASMLYLDYSRREGEWIPNRYGGRENLDAIDFLRVTNHAVAEEAPGAFMVAEESTAWGGVTRPVEVGGLGFGFKWNMGWMHDTLGYVSQEPVHRKYHHDSFTFAMLYEYSERFINPLSHDEVVHGKGSLLGKMPGDRWQKFANLRLLLAYQMLRPGKQLLFMGAEVGQEREWDHDRSVDWHLVEDPMHRSVEVFVADLGRLYHATPALWRSECEPQGFEWIDCSDRDQSIVAWVRRDGDDHVVVVLNMTPVPRDDYRIGAPAAGRYVLKLSTDDARYGGSSYATPASIETEPVSCHGRERSLCLSLPPLAAVVYEPAR